MVRQYMGDGVDEYPDDPESINFISYDTNALFVEGADQSFFADRLFANRLMNMIDGLRGGAQQNKIYIFDGPPGCGKSTLLRELKWRAQLGEVQMLLVESLVGPFPEDGYHGHYVAEMGQQIAQEHGDQYLSVPRAEALRALGTEGIERVIEHRLEAVADLGVRDQPGARQPLLDSSVQEIDACERV